MKRFMTLVLAASLPIAAMAQNNYSFDDEVNAELEKMYAQSGQAVKARSAQAPQVQVNVQANPQASAVQSNEQQTATKVAASPAQVADQTQTAAAVAPAVQVQKQPTTVVEASPMQESKAELIRKSRQDAEVQTEQKIVEKLEASRLEDEKRRSDVLFGDKFKALEQDQKGQASADQNQTNGVKIENSPNAVVNQNPVQNAVPVIVADQAAKQNDKDLQAAKVQDVKAEEVKVEKKEDALTKDDVRAEVRASLEEMKPKEEKKSKSYFSGIVGMGDYPDVRNVRGNYSLGVAFGQKANDRLLIEGSFVYSNYDVEQRDMYPVCGYGCTLYPRITNMDQYQGAATVKYQLLGGMFRPYAGGVAAYSYRTFSDKQFGSSSNNAQSHAFDIGVTGGIDLETSESFAIGLDLKYMFNIYSRANNSGFQKSFAQSVYNSDTPIEQLSYMTIGVNARMSF